ncbi:ATP-binding cassette domain-containing protein [Sporolactobacillus sp. Y61]|uniref:ATP-binding cassette domain-containing protein n=1 Tax=Sporolactobacillus sp. Y61 TaxID=3160863 RepID=A0AAU8IJN8_9BACL
MEPAEGDRRYFDARVRKGTRRIVHFSRDNDRQTLKEIRKRVGLVFQFPESQIFAETVEKDICFGPMNFGARLPEAKKIAEKAIRQVGLDPVLLRKSPFSLSGGQRRRVALAGVLATEPDILLLDEPAAGLDPHGQREILSLISRWNHEQGMTVVLVTHDMESVARDADAVVVMEKGEVVFHGDVRALFSRTEQLAAWHLDLPDARRFQLELEQRAGIKLPRVCLTADELTDALIEVGRV